MTLADFVHYRQDTYDSIATVPAEDHELLVNYVDDNLLRKGIVPTWINEVVS